MQTKGFAPVTIPAVNPLPTLGRFDVDEMQSYFHARRRRRTRRSLAIGPAQQPDIQGVASRSSPRFSA